MLVIGGREDTCIIRDLWYYYIDGYGMGVGWGDIVPVRVRHKILRTHTVQ